MYISSLNSSTTHQNKDLKDLCNHATKFFRVKKSRQMVAYQNNNNKKYDGTCTHHVDQSNDFV